MTKNPIKYWLFGVVCLAVLAGLTYHEKTALAEWMYRYDLLPKPEFFTELYFNTYPKFKDIVTNGQQISFSFTIANHEESEQTYTYEVWFRASANNEIKIAKGDADISPGESQTIKINYTFEQFGLSKSSIVVRIPESGREIHFFLGPV